MVRNAKLLAILLAAIMVLAQVPLALAGENNPLLAAKNAGREVSYEGKITWHGLPFLDDDTNSLIASVLDALKFAGRSGSDGDVAYASSGVYLQDQPAIVFDSVVTEEGAYVSSSFLPEPVAIELEDAEQLIARVMGLAESALGLPEGMIEGAIESSLAQAADSANMLADGMPEALEGMVEALLPQLMEWAEAAFEGEAYEGAFTSAYGVDIASTTLYKIGFEDMLNLADIFFSALASNDEYWAFIIAQMKPFMQMTGEEMPPDDEMLTMVKAAMEDVMAALPELREQEIDAYLYYAECCDSAGLPVTNVVQFVVATEDNPVNFYVEWLPGGRDIFILFTVDLNGAMVEISAPAAKASTVGSRTDTERDFYIILTQLQDDEPAGKIKLGVSSKTIEFGNASTCEGQVQLLTMGVFSEEVMGVEAGWVTAVESDGTDVTIGTQVDLTLHMGDDSSKLVTLECVTATGDPQGAPFAIEGTEFFRPAKASDEELAAFATERIPTAAMQAVFYILSLLPEDVMGAVMGEMDIM